MRIRNRWGVVASTLLLGALGAACGKEEGDRSPPPPPPSPAAPVSPATPPPPEAPAIRADGSPASGPIERWYEQRREGQKLGWLRVIWAPSTWEGKPTIRDTTTSSTRSARRMMEHEDEFGSESTTDTERGIDGTLWWMRSVSRENAERTTITETKWVGDGYERTEKVGDAVHRMKIPAAAPAHVDTEALLSSRVGAGDLKPGDTFVVRELNVRDKRIDEHRGEVIGSDLVKGPSGEVITTKVKVVEPETRSESLWWLDGEGAVARLKQMSFEVVRVAQEKALQRPARSASFSITASAYPALERIFSAERVLVDVHLRPDPDRPLPEFPESPWSRVLSVEGDEKKGHVLHAELRAYDVPDAKATIPVTDAAFARDLESDVMLQCDHPDVKGAARRAVGGETDARKAAERIADFVYTLRKASGNVAEATALEILRTMQGDCSEHARLFVALCRAAGIPARECSGFVCIGSDWGGHAWAEIWTGAWIGVDPTTADVGTAARYLFYGYHGVPGSNPGTVSARATGRMRLVFRHLDEGDDHLDFAGPETWTEVDSGEGRARHHLAGIELRGIPENWQVVMTGNGMCTIRAPEGRAMVTVHSDQGMRGDRLRELFGDGGDERLFAGAPAFVSDDVAARRYRISSRKRIVQVSIMVPRGEERDAYAAKLEKVLAPTFTPKPTAP